MHIRQFETLAESGDIEAMIQLFLQLVDGFKPKVKTRAQVNERADEEAA